MAFFDLNELRDKVNDLNLKGKITDIANSGVAQSKKIAEIAKLKTSNIAEDDIVRRTSTELGRLYYAQMATEAEGEFAALCEKITAAKATIEANNARLSEMKNSNDASDEIIVDEVVANIDVEDADVTDVETETAVTDEDIVDEKPNETVS